TAELVETEGTGPRLALNDLSLNGFLPTVLFVQLKESNINAERGVRRPCKKAFRNHPAGIDRFGIDEAEIPSMLVFDRRPPIWIQQVPFVQNRVRDLPNDVRSHAIRALTFSSSICRSASSKVGMPRSILY